MWCVGCSLDSLGFNWAPLCRRAGAPLQQLCPTLGVLSLVQWLKSRPQRRVSCIWLSNRVTLLDESARNCLLRLRDLSTSKFERGSLLPRRVVGNLSFLFRRLILYIFLEPRKPPTQNSPCMCSHYARHKDAEQA